VVVNLQKVRQLNRREILLFAATVAGGGSITYGLARPNKHASVARLFGDVTYMELIGAECAKALNMQANELQQAAGLAGHQSQSELLHSYATKREQDFLSGRIVTVNGWILAEAECAVCALVALS
jgi:hypothetical protein